MNRYILVRRLRGPAFLLLTGVNALLNQADILSWGHSWPFYLILAGVLKLAERMALSSDGYPAASYPGAPYPGQPYPGQPYPGAPIAGQPQAAYSAANSAPAEPTTAIVPAAAHDLTRNGEGGQS